VANRSELNYPVRLLVILKYFGQLCLILSALTVVPCIASLFFREYLYTLVYGLIVLATAIGGWLLSLLKAPQKMQVNEALVLVVGIFLFVPLMMSLPLMMSGLSFVDALFEAVSGATTTGLSMIEDVNAVPPLTLFARSWMQWYGGLGIVVFSLALLMSSGSVSKTLIKTGTEANDLVGGTKMHARRILYVYLLFTIVGVAGLLLLGINGSNTFSLVFASVSTGGFAPYNDSLASLGWGAQTFIIALCFLSATSLPFYHRLYKEKWKMTIDAVQVSALLVCGLIAACVFMLFWAFDPAALLLAFSAQTTTGFSNVDVASLNPASKLILIVSMFIGGGIGSTAGGIKILRLLIMIKVIASIVKKTAAPEHAVEDTRIHHFRIRKGEQRNALILIALFGAVITLSWLPFIAMDYDPLDSLFEVVSATATTGLSAGVTAPELPVLLKLVLCADMYLGRLEIVPWLVIASKITWFGKRMEGS
jgi:trk system potassium uptake protein